ncbi:F-box protein GID2-like [Juglans microcarpa x Juglans regia]|uniref:F-box protein GID2-like n=1 Tax=Juglans microcarpa x Juglans regia TaxID=2249226 RepID=UPI001B7E72BA|nr:F-box protein GID2-like [Juglans microcarpa x Juglans regia]
MVLIPTQTPCVGVKAYRSFRLNILSHSFLSPHTNALEAKAQLERDCNIPRVCDRKMKRALHFSEFLEAGDYKRKRTKLSDEQEEKREEDRFVNLNEDLLFEVLKHVDAGTLATAACVSKKWRNTANDERLWEMICTRHCANVGCGSDQLRSVVLALGGFRRLHAFCLWPLLKTSSSRTLSASSFPSKKGCRSWGKDEVQLSLSLLSIRYYEKMDCSSQACSNRKC